MNHQRRQGAGTVLSAVLCSACFGLLAGTPTGTVCAARDFDWAFMKGFADTGHPGIYGTILTPALGNMPGARGSASTWVDPSGAFWLFGGYGAGAAGAAGTLNDLWKYDRATGMWTWMKGASTTNQSGSYGSLPGTSPASTPGGRTSAATWVDTDGKLWLFGGNGYDGAGSAGWLNDLWQYDPTTGNWTWVMGPSTTYGTGYYGTILVPTPANLPGARTGAASWTDGSGNLWLFGGNGCDITGAHAFLNDLWRFSPETQEWTWVKGSKYDAPAGTYGTLGEADADNTPSGRVYTATWIDPSGSLWLFGGLDSMTATVGYLNDLWKFTPATGNWTWMKGPSSFDQPGVYGTPGVPTPENVPSSRLSPLSWTDPSGDFWLFGGLTHDGSSSPHAINDLWRYDRNTGNWVWVDGSSTTGQFGNYAALGGASPASLPGARYSSSTWIDRSSGALWFFGGAGYGESSGPDMLGDLWRTFDNVRPTGSIVINDNRSVTNNPNVTLALGWSDGFGSGVVRMRFSNDGATWSAWEPLAATKAWTLSAGDAHKTVRVMYRDRAGNYSLPLSDFIRLDTIPPEGSILINGGAASTIKPNVSLGLTWTDGDGSGVTRMRFSIDGAHWSLWEPPLTPRPYALPATPGYYTVRVQYLDGGNNHSPVCSDYIKLLAP